MPRIFIPILMAIGLMAVSGERSPQASAANDADRSKAAWLEELLAAECVDAAALEAAQAASRLPQEGGVASDAWPPRAIGGVIAPIRSVSDPFPTFDSIALDTE